MDAEKILVLPALRDLVREKKKANNFGMKANCADNKSHTSGFPPSNPGKNHIHEQEWHGKPGWYKVSTM